MRGQTTVRCEYQHMFHVSLCNPSAHHKRALSRLSSLQAALFTDIVQILVQSKHWFGRSPLLRTKQHMARMARLKGGRLLVFLAHLTIREL